MTQKVQVAVIGGGIVGCSALYGLAKRGRTDAVLLERRQLTSGSTWHAAGNTTYSGPYGAMTRLFTSSIETYLEAELSRAIERLPAFGEAVIKTVNNGPGLLHA